jgi:hypothetical protein
MTVAPNIADENTVRRFLGIISAHAVELAKGSGKPGVLQLSTLSPVDETLIPHRFRLDDVDGMVGVAVAAANAGLNVYIEARTLRPGLRGKARGTIADTGFVFGLVVDADHDKGKGGVVTVPPTLAVETSRGNRHYWYLFDKPGEAEEGRRIGDLVRAHSGTDSDTGVITQCYRVAGTPNYPSKAKRARGRVSTEPTCIIEQSGRLWDPGELTMGFTGASAMTSSPPSAPSPATPTIDESTLPDELLKNIRDGGVSRGRGAKGDKSRSGLFHHVVGELKKRRWTREQIHALLEKYSNGVAAKYPGRLADEVRRSYDKINGNGSGGPSAGPGPSPAPFSQSPPGAAAGNPGGSGAASPPPPPVPGAPSGPAPGPAPGAGPQAGYVLPTIRIVAGQLPRTIAATEKAVLDSGVDVFARAGSLVYPVGEIVWAADKRRTVAAKLRAFTPDSFLEPVAEAAIFQRWNRRRQAWADIDPPLQLVRMLLARERKWAFPQVVGIIATPTLRPDGSLLDKPGYDPETQLYLWPGVTLPPIPPAPTKDEAIRALAVLKELFAEFSFKQMKPAIDLSVALVGLLTALLRGSLPTSPVVLARGDTPGVGKSYLVDVIATIATGRICPVITASKSLEETEKRLGSVLLSGSSIVSLDNTIHDLEGELLCQIAERPVVRIRVLGTNEMPDCECHTAIFATGNNVNFKGDMVRRGLTCNLEALDERPEEREFKGDALKRARAERERYIAAALTVARAYLAAGAPKVSKPIASYGEWSTMARCPLVWLGEPDPWLSVEASRKEDPVLSAIREFFTLWPIYLKLDWLYTTARIIEIALEDARSGNFNTPDLRNFLLKVAAERGKPDVISPDRLGWWLRHISGRVVDGRRLVKEHDSGSNVAAYRLINV